jgi:hypothetical protein
VVKTNIRHSTVKVTYRDTIRDTRRVWTAATIAGITTTADNLPTRFLHEEQAH